MRKACRSWPKRSSLWASKLSYRRYDPIIRDASRWPALWRLIFGLATVIVATLGWIGGIVWLRASATGASFPGAMQSTMDASNPEPGAAALILFLVLGMGLGTVIAARFWHKRRLTSLTGKAARTLRHFAVATLATWAAMALITFISWPFAEPIASNLDPLRWLIWLPLALILVALQTGSEELLFRGYLQSQMAARFRSPAIWLFIPALVFGLVHAQPDLPVFAILAYVLIATAFGLLAGDLTARTGSIGAAWGFHFANNTIAILIVATDGTLSGLGLYKTQAALAEWLTLSPLLFVDLLALVAIWLLIRRVLDV